MQAHLADESCPDLLLHEGCSCRPRLRCLHIIGIKARRLGGARRPRWQALLRRVVARLLLRRGRAIIPLLLRRVGCAGRRSVSRPVAPRASGRHRLLRRVPLRRRVARGVACSKGKGEATRRESWGGSGSAAGGAHLPARRTDSTVFKVTLSNLQLHLSNADQPPPGQLSHQLAAVPEPPPLPGCTAGLLQQLGCSPATGAHLEAAGPHVGRSAAP